MKIQKVAALLLRYDYGIPARGESMEKRLFVPAMREAFGEVACFWLEDNGFPDDKSGLQRRAEEFVRREAPDLAFFVLMRDEIQPETLDRIGKVCPTANWFCDDQWRFDDYSSRLASHLNWAITTDKFSVPMYERLGGAKPILTQWAAEAQHAPVSIDEMDYEFDVSFVGGANSTRRYYVDYLRKEGVAVECFGQGWPNGRVSPERMREIFRRTRVNLNLSNSIPAELDYYKYTISQFPAAAIGMTDNSRRPVFRKTVDAMLDIRDLFGAKKRGEQVKARTFEISASGGFQVCHYALGMEDYFSIGEEIVVFASCRDLVRIARYYLEKEEERRRIARAGHSRARTQTYASRFVAIRDQMLT